MAYNKQNPHEDNRGGDDGLEGKKKEKNIASLTTTRETSSTISNKKIIDKSRGETRAKYFSMMVGAGWD